MEPSEFDAFWSDAKTIVQDISFEFASKETGVLEFEGVEVLTSAVLQEATIHGRYLCRTREVCYNFVLKGVGPVARYDVRGSRHGNAGRTHLHRLRHAADSRQNLPHAESRPDLDCLSAHEVWKLLLIEAGITHTGNFFEPEVQCSTAQTSLKL